MKTKRFLGILLLAGIVILAMGCHNDSTDYPVLYGTLSNGVTQVWYEEGVTEAQCATAFTTLNALLAGGNLNSVQKDNFPIKITKVNVKSTGTAISHSGTTLIIAFNSSEVEIAVFFVMNDILAHLQPTNAIYLAQGHATAAGHALAAAAKIA